MKLNDLIAALDDMHREVSYETSKARSRRKLSHNKKTNAKECNFSVGDFVLRGTVQRYESKSAIMRRKGPYQVVTVLSNHLYELQDLRTKEKAVVHGSRIKFFRNKDLEVDEKVLEYLAFQAGEYCLIDELLRIREKNGKIQV